MIGIAPDGRPRPDGFESDGAQAFLVRMSAERPSLDVHFHTVDQFQLFCFGGARFGGHEVAAGTIHYADRHVPYGPLRPGVDGVSFLTLRPVDSSGAYYMPASQEMLRERRAADERERRRNLTFEFGASSDTPGDWLDHHVDLDGLRISEITIEPGQASEPIAISGHGAYLSIQRGAIVTEHGECEPGSLAWAAPHTTHTWHASARGAAVLVAQFPG